LPILAARGGHDGEEGNMSNQDQPPQQGTFETSGGAALDTALAYHRAWTSHDFDRAMTYIAEDIVCQAPSGRLDGTAAFRGFMGPFAQILTRSSLIAAFGDDEKAVVMYDTDTVPVKDAPGAECVTVRGGKITHMRIVFDRLPFEEARRAAGTG
jgi:SnoaL-like domain